MTSGFVLDDFSQWTKTLGKGAIIAEENPTGQDAVNLKSRLFGFDALFGDPKTQTGDPTSGLKNWERLKTLAQTNAYKSAATNKLKAEMILDHVLAYKKGVLDNRGDSSEWFYAQNFQSDIPDLPDLNSYKADANGFYAQVAAIVWAFRQYKPDIPIIPVFDSYLMKSAGTFDITTIQQNLGLLGLTNSKGDSIITKIPEAAPVNSYGTGNNWNIISTLYHSNLIDGFIGDSFKVGKEGTIPSGDLPEGHLPFYLEKSNLRGPIPYALDSNYYDLTYLEAATPITSNYFGNIYNYGESFKFGDMPLSASIYVPTEVPIDVIVDGKKTRRTLAISLPDNFDSKLYITPQKTPLGQGLNAQIGYNPAGSTYATSNGDYNTENIANDGTLINAKELYNYGSITNAGNLENNGIISSYLGEIVNTGLLSGSGSLYGDIINSGTISPGNSAGGHLIDGNFYQKEGSTKEIELSGTYHGDGDRTATEYDWIEITGDLELDGKFDISLIDGFKLSVGDSFVITKVDGDLSGQYDGFNQGDSVGRLKSDNGGTLDLFVTYQGGDGNDIELYTKSLFGVLPKSLRDPRIIGSAEIDLLTGTSANEVIFGANGDDILLGRSGDDHVTGGNGNDRLDGGSGDDKLKGDRGADTYTLSRGDDVIIGFSFAEKDRISVADGVDLCFKQVGDDLLIRSDRNLFSFLSAYGIHTTLLDVDKDEFLAADVVDFI